MGYIHLFQAAVAYLLMSFSCIIYDVFDKEDFPASCLVNSPCYFGLLAFALIPVTFIFLLFNWMGFKLFIQN